MSVGDSTSPFNKKFFCQSVVAVQDSTGTKKNAEISVCVWHHERGPILMLHLQQSWTVWSNLFGNVRKWHKKDGTRYHIFNLVELVFN